MHVEEIKNSERKTKRSRQIEAIIEYCCTYLVYQKKSGSF